MRHQTIRYLTLGICAFAGALLLHCGGQMMGSDGGGVPDANGQQAGCCTTAPTFVPLADVQVPPRQTSAAIAVGAYREIVVYAVGPSCYLDLEWRPAATSPFGLTEFSGGGSWIGRRQVQGSDVRISTAGCNISSRYIVAVVAY